MCNGDYQEWKDRAEQSIEYSVGPGGSFMEAVPEEWLLEQWEKGIDPESVGEAWGAYDMAKFVAGMNLVAIQDAVEKIENKSSDYEAAHKKEDNLRTAFIRFIAEQASPELAEMARAVLKTEDIVFDRYCA